MQIGIRIVKMEEVLDKKTSYDTEATHKSCIETRKERLCVTDGTKHID